MCSSYASTCPSYDAVSQSLTKTAREQQQQAPGKENVHRCDDVADGRLIPKPQTWMRTLPFAARLLMALRRIITKNPSLHVFILKRSSAPFGSKHRHILTSIILYWTLSGSYISILIPCRHSPLPTPVSRPLSLSAASAVPSSPIAVSR